MKPRPIVLLLACAAVFFVVNVMLATPVATNTEIGQRFDWPDETANYFWSNHFAKTDSLVVPVSLNAIAANQIHPRSFNVRGDGAIVPGSFLGLILLYGVLAKLFTSGVLIYLTPLLGIGAVLAWFGIIKRIFDERIALISSIIMLFHPAWWYYSVTTMLPNVAFVALILISVYCIVSRSELHLFHFILAGVSVGLALSIRPVELPWVIIAYAAVAMVTKKQWSISRWAVFLGVTLLCIAPSLYYQQQIYGSAFVSGYSQLQLQPEASGCAVCQAVKSFLAPFGFNPRLIVINFWTHFVARIWWLTLVGILGLVSYLVVSHRHREELFGYVLMSLGIFAWLVVYYGSWQFSDLLTVNLNTLGISYVRYWLPLYILSLPFIALGIVWVAQLVPRQFQAIVIVVVLLLLAYPSMRLVLFDKADSIMPVRQRIAEYKKVSSQVNALTPTNAVIVTVRKDKVLFPDRAVIHSFDLLSHTSDLVTLLPAVVKTVPVYYLSPAAEATTTFSNGLTLTAVATTTDSEILYHVQ